MRFRKTFNKGVLRLPSIKLYYSFSVSFYPAKRPLAFVPDWAPWGWNICSEPISTCSKSNALGTTVINNNISVTYGRPFHSLAALHKNIIPSYFVFKYLVCSTVLLALKLSGSKGEDCAGILIWISRMAVFLEGNSLHAENNCVWTITVLIPGSECRDFKPVICRSLCF